MELANERVGHGSYLVDQLDIQRVCREIEHRSVSTDFQSLVEVHYRTRTLPHRIQRRSYYTVNYGTGVAVNTHSEADTSLRDFAVSIFDVISVSFRNFVLSSSSLNCYPPLINVLGWRTSTYLYALHIKWWVRPSGRSKIDDGMIAKNIEWMSSCGE